MLLLIGFLSITVPYRIPFEDITPPSWLYLDIVIDILFIVDIIFNFFTALEDFNNGELCVDRKKIVWSYMKSWMLIDISSSIPISLIQKLSNTDGEQSSNSSILNVRIIKLSKLPRLYRLLRLLKLMKLLKGNKFIERITMHLNMKVTASKLMKSFIRIVYFLHLIGCIWVMIAVLNPLDDPVSWLSSANLQDADNVDVYIAAIYWSTVSVFTVGYGDITCQNLFELIMNNIILVVGIINYSYIFSQLSVLFSSVSERENIIIQRERKIIEVSQEFQFPSELTKNILFFFQESKQLITLSKE